jgi:DNA invertase Pin-like site-specific DNA recombinase
MWNPLCLALVRGDGRERARALIFQRTKSALAVRKAQGVKLGGLNAKGIANREDAKARAEALRPMFTELAGLSANAIAVEPNKRRGDAERSPWSAVTVIRVQRRLAALG